MPAASPAGTAAAGGSRSRRADLCIWLSTAFSLPVPDVVTANFARAGLALREVLFAPDCAPQLDLLLRDAEAHPISDARWIDLQRDYARLFLGPPRALVQPYESCYFGSGMLMSERTRAVQQFYTAHGVILDAWQGREAPDHIAVELEFLAMALAGTLPAAQDAGVAPAFVEAHLGCWGPAFAEAVGRQARDPLYGAAAALLAALLEIDKAGA